MTIADFGNADFWHDRWRSVLLLAALSFSSISCLAVNPTTRITQYSHTAWRVQDGFFKGSPLTLVQTKDGYLWLGTSSELLRFDGVHFARWEPENGEESPSGSIGALTAAPDGGLWIRSDSGLSRWKDRRLIHIPIKGGDGGVLFEDREGSVWSSAFDSPSASLCRVIELTTRCTPIPGGVGFPYSLIGDQRGDLWMGGSTGLLRWSNGVQTLYQTPALKANTSLGITALANAVDGSIWVGAAKRGRGLGLQRMIQGRWHSFKTRGLDGEALQVMALHVDQSGALWIGTADQGIYRIYKNEVDHFDASEGLSSDTVLRFLEDREGNLWVATDSGVDRFTDRAVVAFTKREGLCRPEVASLLPSRNGSLWIGSDGALNNLRDWRVSCVYIGRSLPGNQVTSLLEDHQGRLWVGLDSSLWVEANGRFRKIAKPDGSEIGFVTGLDEDADHNIWVASKRSSSRVLMRIRNFSVQEEYDGAPMVRRVAADPTGGVWLGLVNGDLSHLREGVLASYPFVHGESAGVFQLLAAADGSVLAATDYGLIGRQGGRNLLMDKRNGLPCNEVNGIVFDNSENLWMFMNCALGRVSNADLQGWKRNPDAKVPLQTFDELDGVRTGLEAFLEAVRSSDGRLWFSNGFALQVVDPNHLHRNAIPPPIHIEQIIADHKSFSIAGQIFLPPLTRDLEISYSGLSLTAPQKVHFRYRLDGRDQSWQDAGTRRQAFYTDLRPGRYHFRVIGSNNDDLWNEEGATLDFVIRPAWYQTRTFLILFALTGLLAAWLLFGLRMRQIAFALNSRFEERLAERTRIARDLHDTFLQTIQGSKMFADTALKQSGDSRRMQAALERLSIWLARATEEGRAALNSLRTSTTETNDLAEAFRRAIEECRLSSSIQASFSLVGDTREMHPIVRDEVYRIGYEAIRNACEHSQAKRLQLTLIYANDLNVRIADDGVGMDVTIAEHGKEGHFGLQGMRERAARIAGKLTFTSSPSGTEVNLVVPGKAIYRKIAANRHRAP
jgi:ligand-binding sensor domain-containing protein